MKIIPTIFSRNKKEFSERLEKLLPVSKNLQIDFMDGKFVRSKSIQPNESPNLKKYKNKFEAHLMVKNPEKYLEQLNQKGFSKVIFHIESTKSPKKVIELIDSFNLLPYIALNPETPTERVFPFLSKIKGVLFMGVHPGKEHQSFIPEIYEKIKLLKSVNKAVKIQVDGGVNEIVIKKLAKLNVNYINSGSLISESLNPKQTYKKLTALSKEPKK